MTDLLEISDSCEDVTNEMEPHKEILKEFRSNVSDVLTPDVTDQVLLKWLRAKKFNLQKSEELYRVSNMTKAVYGIDELEYIWDVPYVVEEYEFSSNLGFAKDGTPIRYIAAGKGDFKGFLMSLDLYDLGRYCAGRVERDLKLCKLQSKKLDREINEVTYIMDLDGFSIRQILFQGVLELSLDMINLLQDQYPEIWKNIFIVNVPFYFQTLFNLFKPILRNTILKYIHVTTKEQTASLLLNYVDAEVLPEFLGGKRVDSSGDPMCSEFIKYGGIIPEMYYLRKQCLLLPTDFGVEDVLVPARSCYNFNLVVREANSLIRVETKTEGGSLLAMLLYRKFGPDPENTDLAGEDEYLDPADRDCNVEQLSPVLHMQTHLCPINNYCFAPFPGIYIFRFDNSNSWWTSRRLIFRFRLLSPDAWQD